MQIRVNVFWKIVFIVLLIILSLVPFYFMQQYIENAISERNSITNLASQSINYVASLIESMQDKPTSQATLDLQQNFLLSANNIKSAPLMLGLALLFLLVLDIIKSSKLSLISYFIITTGLILFYLIEIVLARYIDFAFAYLVSAIFCSLLLLFYLSGAMKSIVAGIVYCVGLLIVYAITFYFIKEVDNFLMYSAGILVAIFVLVICVTRKIDWHQATGSVKSDAKKLN